MPDYHVYWTSTARVDLEEIVSFIAAESPSNAIGVLDKLEERALTLRSFPERGRIVPELRAVDVLLYRELIEGPWRIIYRFDEKQVYVIAVLDARRNLAGLLLERLAR